MLQLSTGVKNLPCPVGRSGKRFFGFLQKHVVTVDNRIILNGTPVAFEKDVERRSKAPSGSSSLLNEMLYYAVI
jgi:hypothetical protein